MKASEVRPGTTLTVRPQGLVMEIGKVEGGRVFFRLQRSPGLSRWWLPFPLVVRAGRVVKAVPTPHDLS